MKNGKGSGYPRSGSIKKHEVFIKQVRFQRDAAHNHLKQRNAGRDRGFATTALAGERTSRRERCSFSLRVQRVSLQVTRLDLSVDIVIYRPDVRASDQEGGTPPFGVASAVRSMSLHLNRSCACVHCMFLRAAARSTLRLSLR